MTSVQFCYWLQGFFELRGKSSEGLTPAQSETIERHLHLVFKHEIDPQAGGPEHQAALNAIHHGNKPSAAFDPGTLPLDPHTTLRC